MTVSLGEGFRSGDMPSGFEALLLDRVLQALDELKRSVPEAMVADLKTALAQLPAEVQTHLQAAVADMRRSIADLPAPVVHVDAQAPEVHVAPADLSEIVQAVVGLKPGASADDIAAAIRDTIQFPSPPDQAPVTTALAQVAETLKKLEFRLRAVPQAYGGASNTAIKDADNSDHTLKINADGSINVGGVSVTAAGDGAILDGDNPAVKASVLDYVNSNPLAVRLTDTGGDYVSAGAGTQYTEDAASPADLIGSALVARRRDTLSTETSADGDVTALNSTAKGELYVKHIDPVAVTGSFYQATQPVSGTVTANAGTGTWIADVSDRVGRLLGHVAVDGSVAVTGTFWQATQPVSGTVTANVGTTNGLALDGTDGTSPPAVGGSGTGIRGWLRTIVDKLSGTLSTNATIQNSTLAVTESGTWNVGLSTGSNTVGKVDQGTGGASAWKTDGSAVTQPVSGTVTANAGTGTFSDQHSNATADYDSGAGTQNLTMFGVAVPKSGGAVAGGTSADPLRTDPTGTTTQPVSGTFWQATQPVSGTVTANAQPVISGGLSMYRNLDAGSTGVNIKASAGQVYGYYIYNNAAAARYVKIYDKASAPTSSDTPVLTLPLPASSAANLAGANGIAFANGIGVRATTGVADADTGAPTANDVVVNVLYK